MVSNLSLWLLLCLLQGLVAGVNLKRFGAEGQCDPKLAVRRHAPQKRSGVTPGFGVAPPSDNPVQISQFNTWVKAQGELCPAQRPLPLSPDGVMHS